MSLSFIKRVAPQTPELIEEISGMLHKVHVPLDDSAPAYDASTPLLYPCPTQYTPSYSQRNQQQNLQQSLYKINTKGLGLCLHLPFSMEPCYFANIGEQITLDSIEPTTQQSYYQSLLKEIEMYGQHYAKNTEVVQLSIKGAPPNQQHGGQLYEMMSYLAKHFKMTKALDREYEISIEPHSCSAEFLEQLSVMGFTNLRFPIEDFSAEVLRLIGRHQNAFLVSMLMTSARQRGFHTITFDLLYGLPGQTVIDYKSTICSLVKLSPDRIQLSRFKLDTWQSSHKHNLTAAMLPTQKVCEELFTTAVNMILDSGYIYLGNGLYVRYNDTLQHAKSIGCLNHTTHGFTSQNIGDMVALGLNNTGEINQTYYQNVAGISEYCEALSNDKFPIATGKTLGIDESKQRFVINSILTNGVLNKLIYREIFQEEFSTSFANLTPQLDEMVANDLLTNDDALLIITDKGRFLTNQFCHVIAQAC